MTTIEETIARLRELDQEASPAPWVFTGTKRTGYDTIEPGDLLESNGLELIPEIERVCPPTDAQLIAEARNAIPALLAEIERLTEENQTLKRENQLAWSKGHAAGWDCHIVTMQAADLLPKDQKTSSPYQEIKKWTSSRK